ncbi:MAG: phosphate ABC transporter substrate-binding protein [Planctomycetes bacterium]|nr:phosphate ABC transporter substrate-binding protein [Planctomycetota bacterium]
MSRIVLASGLAVLAAGVLCLPDAHAQQSGKAETTIVVDGSTTVGPIAKAFAEYFMSEHSNVNITVSESGSGNGAKSLINGACDIADMSRFMKENEFKAAVAKGVMPVAHIVAMDGLPVIVHPSNPIKELTVEQVRGIYAGQITNWQQVGGPNKEIVKISRETNSGTYETFVQLVMKETRIAADTEYVGSNGAARQRVQATPAAIAYAGLGFVDRTVKALRIDGIEPNRATVATGVYPIARPLYMFTNGYPKLGSATHAFVTLYLTAPGQEIIESIGFVPVTNYPTSPQTVSGVEKPNQE